MAGQLAAAIKSTKPAHEPETKPNIVQQAQQRLKKKKNLIRRQVAVSTLMPRPQSQLEPREVPVLFVLIFMG